MFMMIGSFNSSFDEYCLWLKNFFFKKCECFASRILGMIFYYCYYFNYIFFIVRCLCMCVHVYMLSGNE